MNWKAKQLSLLLVLCVGAALASGADAGKSGDGKPSAIRISGSATMLNLTQRLTQWYAGRHREIAFKVEGGSPSQGFVALIESKGEIAQSTRKALDGEVGALRTRRKLEFVEIPVATEFAVIAVNTANPIRALTTFELRAVLSGQIKNWKQVGGYDAPIHLLGRDETSEVRNLIDEEFMGDANFSGAIKILPTNTAVMAAVANDPSALAFCDVDLHPPRAVRLIGIKASVSSEAIEPTGENIREHKYMLSRTLYFYFAGAPSPELTKFAAWVVSSEGQLVVEAVGLYPLGSVDREEARQRLDNRSRMAASARYAE